MYCENCGNKISNQARFCQYCGHKMEDSREASSPVLSKIFNFSAFSFNNSNISKINEWLNNQSIQIENVSMMATLNDNVPFMWETFISRLEIQYREIEGTAKYQMEYFTSLKWIGTSYDVVDSKYEEWVARHPEKRVVWKSHAGHQKQGGNTQSLFILYETNTSERVEEKPSIKKNSSTTYDIKDISFSNQGELSSWLMQHKNIEIESIKYELINERRFFKTYVTTRGIVLSYFECEGANHEYHFVETREKWAPSIDIEVIKNNWKELYPKYEVIDQQVYESDENDGNYTMLTIYCRK